jgi:Homeodomain-like domain
VFIVLDVEQAEQDLTAGRLTCPSCAGTLRPWSWAPVRLVRQRDGTTRPVRPRRARCARCHATRVLLPASCQPRLADATEVVGAALAAKAAGLGYRRIAAQLARSPSTVRRWLRRARSDRHVAGLYCRGVARIHQLDPEILAAGLPPQPTRLGDALQALAAAVAAYRRRVDRHVDGWALIGAFTTGRLLAPGPSG